MLKDKELLALIILTIATLIFFIAVPNHDIPQTETYYESHIVEEGETLSEIVERYGGSLIKTQSYNGVGNWIMPGQRIEVVVEVDR